MGELGSRRKGNPPAEVSSFVGRRAELAEIERLLAASRLVTVTGVGGVGKSRAAQRVASQALTAYPDGVWFVELSGLREGGLLPHAVADALGLGDQTARSQVDVLAEFLAERRLLLVLDTCEHLLGACALLAQVILSAAPQVRILATSRRPLGIEGEQIFPMPPLPVPALDGTETDGEAKHEALVGNDSMVLFQARAGAVDPAFDLTPGNALAAARLCRRLDGIPLAIELAAVRLRALTLEQIVERLDDRFQLLTRGDRATVPRHETLRTAIGWSHELCEPPERLLWARLSVFAGAFDLAAVRAVCADDRLPAGEVGGLVESLVEKSILWQEPGDRFRMLDTLREYGQEWLTSLGEDERLVLLRRHRDHYLRLARQCEDEWCGPGQVEWSRRFKAEHADVRAALDFCLADPREHRSALELAGALRFFWYACGLLREGRHYLAAAINLSPEPGPALTKALWVSAQFTMSQGDLGETDVWLARCRPHLAEDDVEAAAWMSYIAGGAAVLRSEPAEAIALTTRAVELHRRGGDTRHGLLLAQATQGMALIFGGQSERGVAVLTEVRETCQRYGEQWVCSWTDYVQGLAEIAHGDIEAAIAHSRESLKVKWRLNDSTGIALALELLASGCAVHGDADRTARLLGIAHQVWHTFGLPGLGSQDLVAMRTNSEALARKAIGDDAYDAAFEHGTELDLDDALSYALAQKGG
ncbi:hypothetical protein Misp01_81540 [Microtetraspora sp. NBRC 13810]|nr:hypothetical protein Misp01_81540 [Microtetraspora sp. NBRC 13810]